MTSTFSAHYVVQKLREQGYLAANEHGKLTPGPLFPKAPHRPQLPGELLKELPAVEGLRVLRVEEDWKLEEGAQFIAGDLLILAPVERFAVGDLLVLRRSQTRQVSSSLRSGWQAVGVLVGQYRALNTPSSSTGGSPSAAPSSVAPRDRRQLPLAEQRSGLGALSDD